MVGDTGTIAQSTVYLRLDATAIANQKNGNIVLSQGVRASAEQSMD